MPQRVFKTRQAWQPHAGSVRLRGRSARVLREAHGPGEEEAGKNNDADEPEGEVEKDGREQQMHDGYVGCSRSVLEPTVRTGRVRLDDRMERQAVRKRPERAERLARAKRLRHGLVARTIEQ